MGLSRVSAILSLLGLLLLGGCASSPPVHFYQLQAGSPRLPEGNRGIAVLLGPLKVADYLQRESVVQRLPDGSLQLGGTARWAGSLDDDIARLLLAQLASRLDSSRLALYPDRVGFQPEVQVLLNISRLDSGPGQPAVLEANWRLLDGRGQMQASRVVRLEGIHDGTLAAQVRAQSGLLQELAGQIAAAVKVQAELAEAAAASRRPAAPPRRRAPAHSVEPRIPVVSPAAGAGGVYRF